MSSDAIRDSAKDTLLNGVTTTGASSAISGNGFSKIGFQITAASVSTGGTVLIQASNDGTNWGTLNTTSISGNGTTLVHIAEKWAFLRANLSARTDGTYTVIGEVEFS